MMQFQSGLLIKRDAMKIGKIGCLIGCWLILNAGMGCTGRTIRTTVPVDTGVVLTFASAPRPVSGPVDASERIPADQLHTASRDLETFRLFCSHFKFQNDQQTVTTIQQPALDYIRQYIDPILLRRHRLQDDDYSRQIIAVYYSKAYLFGIFGKIASARSMAAQMRKDIPVPLQKKSLLRTDQEDVTIAEALKELDVLLADRPASAEQPQAD